MKRLLVPAVLAAALTIAPALSLADESNGAPQPPPGFAIMEQAHSKVEQLHSQARLSMLNALTPAHRTLLAQVVGQLAIAANPDAAAASRQLDASLSPTESRTIVSINTSLEQQTRTIMESAHQQMMKSLPPGDQGPGGEHHMGYFREARPGEPQMQNDPGMILLATAARSVGPQDMMFIQSVKMQH